MSSFVCPDCRAEHDAPADAAYVLVVRCLDCDLHAAYHAARVVAIVLPEAA